MADNTAYGPTPSVGAADFQATEAKDYHTESITNSSGTDYAPGQVVVVNGLVGVTTGLIANGATGNIVYFSAFNVVKDGSAFNQNDPVYWQAAGNPYGRTAGTGAASSSSAASAPLMGFALAAAGATADRVQVSLRPQNGTSISVVNQSSLSIVDPGNGQAIPVTSGGTCELTGTTGAQTRTLAAPTFAGQEITLVTKAITSGTLTITVTNLTDDGAVAKTTIAQSTAGMVTILRGILVGSTLTWIVVVSGGTVS